MNRLDADACALAQRILSSTQELTLASVRADGSPHASTLNFASDGLTIYAAISLDCEKAHEISRDDRVGLTVNLPYANWSAIQGLSIHGRALFVSGQDELIFVAALLRKKLPAYDSIIARPDILPWPGMLFLRIVPQHLALIDYTVYYGHTRYFALDGAA